MNKFVFIICLLTASLVNAQVPLHKEDFKGNDDAYYTYADDEPPYDSNDSYLATLLFIYHNDVSLTNKTKAKVCKEIGYVYYMKHKHESADYFFFKANKYFEMPSIVYGAKKTISSSDTNINKPKMFSISDHKMLEKTFSQTYDNLSKDDINKLILIIDAQIKKLTKERDSIIQSENPNPELISSKNNMINVLKKEKALQKSIIKTIDLKTEKELYRKYLIWSIIALVFLLIIIILVILSILQKRKIARQRGTIKEQIEDIHTKNIYLEHAAKLIRHDMHSGINTYIPRGISGIESRLNQDDIKNLKLDSPLKMIKEGLKHTQKVYKNVYEFTNLVKKDVVLVKNKLDLRDILESFLSGTSYANQVTIGDLGKHDVNELLFCVAIDNLIRNGLKYNNSVSKHIDIFMENDSELAIQDNGVGMTQEEFIKVSKPDSKKDGLGLGICIAILKEHGFSVSCEKNDIGTKIKIKLK